MDGYIPLSAHSCVAARGLLKISQEELAGLAGMSISTLRRLERGDARVGKYANEQVLKALRAQGISFVGSGFEAELARRPRRPDLLSPLCAPKSDV